MSRSQAWALHGSHALVAGTGLAYAYYLYLCEPIDEFAIVNHSLQPQAQHLHVLFAPLLVFAVGWVWQAHVWVRVLSKYRPGRRTGLVLTGLFFPMVMSGYALQVSDSPAWKELWLWTHLVVSGVWMLIGVVHPIVTPKLKRREAGSPGQGNGLK